MTDPEGTRPDRDDVKNPIELTLPLWRAIPFPRPGWWLWGMIRNPDKGWGQ